jgi:hypothetical protein
MKKPKISPTTHCLMHKNHQATGHCLQCHNPYCDDCVVQAFGKRFCTRACADDYAFFQSRYKPDKRPSVLAKFLRFAAILIILAVIAFVAWKLMARTPAGRRVQNTVIQRMP